MSASLPSPIPSGRPVGASIDGPLDRRHTPPPAYLGGPLLRDGRTMRVQGWVHLKRLECPWGHPIRRDTFAFTDNGVRCKHRDANGAECGALVYLLAAARIREVVDPDTVPCAGDGPKVLYVAEVEYGDVEYFERAGLDVLAILRYLGAGFVPRVRPEALAPRYGHERPPEAHRPTLQDIQAARRRSARG